MTTPDRKPSDPNPPAQKQGGENAASSGPPAGDGAARPKPGGMAGEGGSGGASRNGPPRGGVEQGA